MKQRELHKLHKHKSNKSTDMIFQLTFDDKDAINLQRLEAMYRPWILTSTRRRMACTKALRPVRGCCGTTGTFESQCRGR